MIVDSRGYYVRYKYQMITFLMILKNIFTNINWILYITNNNIKMIYNTNSEDPSKQFIRYNDGDL